MHGRIPVIFRGFEFQKNRLKMWEQWGVEFLSFPLTWHIAYIQQLVAIAQAVIPPSNHLP